MAKTDLRIFKNGAEIPLPPGSWRFMTFSKRPINEAIQQRRSIDGTLVNLGYSEMLRYEISISCNDQKIPALSHVVPGSYLTIHSPEVMSEPGPAITLDREPVPGSVKAFNASGVLIAEPEGRTLNVPGAAYFEYRPIFNVMVGNISSNTRDLKAQVSWSLTAQEWESGDTQAQIPPSEVPENLVEATGGTESEYTDEDGKKWRVHDFTSSDVLDVTAPGEIEVAVASGGGGGPYKYVGSSSGGGGGAGGFLRMKLQATVGVHPIAIGSGGAHGTNSSSTVRNGRRGSKSSAFGLSPDGGGGAVGATSNGNGERDGGSGGGQRIFGYQAPGNASPYQGHNGGFGSPNVGGILAGGGGGGAGGPGEDGASGIGGDAGPGVELSDIFGSELTLACGAPGSGMTENGNPATGGSAWDENGAVNTGNGGGADGNGGSGRVIIRYRIQ